MMKRGLLTSLLVSLGGASAGEGTVEWSGELRERATLISDIEWNPDDINNGWFWTQRLAMRVDAAPNNFVRARVSVLSALQEGGAILPIERNNLDLQEAFVELGSDMAFLRLGRQELQLGSQRLVASRDGTNVRRTWDGVRGSLRRGSWQIDSFALGLVEVEPDGLFNDDSPRDNTLAGVYATGPAPLGEIDLYYLHAEIGDRLTVEGLADQERNTVGARLFGDRHGWFWNWEAAYQWGSQGDLTIEAWTVATNTGFGWEKAAWSPEIELSANIGSGDEAPGDGRLNTFDGLYPRGSYFSEASILGPSNFFNVHPYLRVHPREELTVFLDVNFYWRLELADGVYGPPGDLIRAPQGSNDRAVANAVSAGIEFEPRHDVLLSLLATQSVPQGFIEETGPAAPVTFVEASFALRF